MPTITISDPLFTRLQRHAVPFVDTPETVIIRSLDALEAGHETIAPKNNGHREFDPAAPPNLAFTTPTKMVLAGVNLKKGETYWNPLMFACIRAAAAKGLDSVKISELMVIPHVIGKKDDNGYVFIEEAGVSVQGQTSNGAWRQAHHLVEKLKMPLLVEFTWQNDPKAAMPNVKGRFSVA